MSNTLSIKNSYPLYKMYLTNLFRIFPISNALHPHFYWLEFLHALPTLDLLLLKEVISSPHVLFVLLILLTAASNPPSGPLSERPKKQRNLVHKLFFKIL